MVPVMSNLPVSVTLPPAVIPRFPPTLVAPKVVAAALVVRSSKVALPFDTPKVPTALNSEVPVVVKAATKLSASFKVVAEGGYGHYSTKLIGCIIQGHGLTSCGDSGGSSNVQLARVSYGTRYLLQFQGFLLRWLLQGCGRCIGGKITCVTARWRSQGSHCGKFGGSGCGRGLRPSCPHPSRLSLRRLRLRFHQTHWLHHPRSRFDQLRRFQWFQ